VSMLDIALVVVIYIYVLALIFFAEQLRVRKGLPTTFTRRIIHLFASNAIIILPLFSSPIYPALLPIGLIILVTIAFMKKMPIIATSMVEEQDEVLHAYGPVYYMISILILLFLFWEKPYIAMAATFVMSWGDGAATVVAKKLKRVHRYPFSNKSIEGTLAMFFFSFLGALLAVSAGNMLGGFNLTVLQILGSSLIAAAVGAITEALTLGPIRHFDNFTVPFASAFSMLLIV